MPEGDTIRKLATALAAELCGIEVSDLRLRRLQAPVVKGRRVVEVTSKGKHLFIVFDNGLLLRCHLGLYGSWHRYALGETWSRPARQAAIVLDAAGWCFVCFNARQAELLRLGDHCLCDHLNRLGPDLVLTQPKESELMGRIHEFLAPETALVDVLLDQRVACGIGNVYKSEVLFLAGQHPLRRLDETPSAVIVRLYALALELLRRNLGHGPRTTRFVSDGKSPLWVYGRAGEACFACLTPLRRDTLGAIPRSTYWCPTCQPRDGSASGLASSIFEYYS